MTKNILLICLSSLLVIPINGEEVNGIYYKLNADEGTAQVAANPSKYVGDIIIPENFVYDNVKYDVTSIGSQAFDNCSDLKSISIPNTVNSIGYMAFSNCYGLKTVVIPDQVTFMDNVVFDHCINLESVTIGKGLTSISNGMFYGCRRLKSVIMSGNITEICQNAFADCSGLVSVEIPESVTTFGINAFGGCSGLTHITFPSHLKTLDDRVFSGCSSLVSIEIPSEVSSIGEYAFSLCSALESISIPNSVMSIGLYAFEDCKRLKTVSLPDNAATLGGYIFSGCTGLEEIRLSGAQTSIPSHMFYGCSSLKAIDIVDNITYIGESAFEGCSGLESVTFGSGIKDVKDKAFDGCSSLKEVHTSSLYSWCKIQFSRYQSNPLSFAHHLYWGDTEITHLSIPENITEIKTSAFQGCTGFLSVSIPYTVGSIGQSAFAGCSNLTSVSIGNGVKTIGSGAFQNCSGLSTIVLPNSVETIREDAFGGCGLTRIVIGNGIKEIWQGAFGTSGTELVGVRCMAESVPTTNQQAFYPSSLAQASLYVPKSAIPNYQEQSPWSSFAVFAEAPDVSAVQQTLGETFVQAESLMSNMSKIEYFCATHKQGLKEDMSEINSAISDMAHSLSAFQDRLDQGEMLNMEDLAALNFEEINQDILNAITSFKEYRCSNLFTCGEGGKIVIDDITIENEEKRVFWFYSKAWQHKYDSGKVREIEIHIVPNEGYHILSAELNGSRLTDYELPGDEAWGQSFTVIFEQDKTFDPGDVNMDGVVNAQDIVEVMNYMMGKPSEKFNIELSDLNGDGKIDIGDVVMLANIIMGKK